MIHFFRFFFAEPGQPWFHAAVWGNIVALVPSGVLAWMWARSSKAATHALLRQHHAEAMEQRETHELHAEQRHVELLESHKKLGAKLNAKPKQKAA